MSPPYIMIVQSVLRVFNSKQRVRRRFSKREVGMR